MSNISLRRVVTSPISCSDYGVCASFTDLDFKTLSVSFDGRWDCEVLSENYKIYDYTPYTDCIVIDENNEQHQMLGEIESLRVMRDSLNRMNLGD